MATDPDQAWFWTEDWQAGERQADAEIAAGELAVYDDMSALFAEADAATEAAGVVDLAGNAGQDGPR